MEQSSQSPDRGEIINDAFPLEKIERPLVAYRQGLICPKCKVGEIQAINKPGHLFTTAEGVYLIHQCSNEGCKHRMSILNEKYPTVIYKELNHE